MVSSVRAENTAAWALGGCMGSEWNNYRGADWRRVEKVALASRGTDLHAALNLVEVFGEEIELQPF